MTRREWLTEAASQLEAAGIDSARLDAELLLTHALNISRTSLHAHDDEKISDDMLPVLQAMLSLRVIRVPLAYIVGHREFYGRLFKVTPSVLIPRIETEDIVTIIDELVSDQRVAGTRPTIIDVGTGSGALAVTLALEHPSAEVYGIDISQRALGVAANNAATYNASVEFVKGDLLTDFPAAVDSPIFIVANLPYVNETDDRSPETAHEPAEALFAGSAGMAFIDRLIPQAAALLREGDYLLLESNPGQQPAIAAAASENGFRVSETRHLISVLERLAD